MRCAALAVQAQEICPKICPTCYRDLSLSSVKAHFTAMVHQKQPPPRTMVSREDGGVEDADMG